MAGGILLAGTSQSIDNMSETFIAKALEVREHVGVMDKLVDTKKLPNGHGVTWNEPYVGALTAVALTDGEEFDAPTIFTDTNIQITAGEVGVQTLISYRSNDIVKEDLFAIAGRLMANAIEYKRDTDLLSLLDGFAASLGSGTATLTVGHITAAAAGIRSGRGLSGGVVRTGARTTGDPPEGPMFAVVHEYQRRAIAAQLSGLWGIASDATIGTNAPTMAFTGRPGGISDYQAKWFEQHLAGQFDGVKVIVDNNLTITSSATKSGVFSRDALINLKFRSPKPYQVKTDDGRALKMTLSDDYGYGERADAWGVELNVAAATPTT